MKCPIDGANLVMTERAGVEIDYCPTCRGVWLDRGELDKILERGRGEFEAQPAPRQAPQPPQPAQPAPLPHAPYPPQQPGYAPRPRDYDDDDWKKREYYNKKKRKDWLGDIFDF
jgi:uncharacterized protein